MDNGNTNSVPEKEDIQGQKQEKQPSFDGQAFYSEGYKNAFNLVDKALIELGFEKPEGTKTTDFLRDVVSKAKVEKAPEEPKADYSEYEKRLKAFESENKQLQNQLSSLKLQAYESELMKAIPSDLVLPVGLDSAGKEAYTNAIKSQIANELKKVFQEKDGNIIALNPEGIPLMNPNTAKPYTPKEYVSEKFKTFYAIEKKAQEVQIKEIKTEGLNIALDVIPTSKRQVTELLIKNGIPAGRPEHQKAYNQIIEKYNITKL